MNMSKNVSSVVLQVTLIIIFISVFFMTYTTVIEKEIVIHEIDILVAEFFGDLKTALNPTQLSLFRSFLSDIEPPDMSEADSLTAANNSVLIKNTIIVMIIVGIVGFLITGYIVVKYKVDVSEISKDAIFGLLAVCIVEYLFLRFLVRNYVSLDPNLIKLHIVEILQNYSRN